MAKESEAPKLLRYICKEDWLKVLFRTHNYPREATRWALVESDAGIVTSQLPLHQACNACPPVEVVEALLVAYPESAGAKDSFFQRNALHIACMNGASTEVIRLLIGWDKSTLRDKDKLGRLPLHYALFCSLTADVVQLLLEVYPAGAQVQDYKGWLPLHVGARQGATSEVLAALITANPESIHTKTIGGMTASDISKKSGVSSFYSGVWIDGKPLNDFCVPISVEVEESEVPSLAKPWSCVGAYLVDDTN